MSKKGFVWVCLLCVTFHWSVVFFKQDEQRGGKSLSCTAQHIYSPRIFSLSLCLSPRSFPPLFLTFLLFCIVKFMNSIRERERERETIDLSVSVDRSIGGGKWKKKRVQIVKCQGRYSYPVYHYVSTFLSSSLTG